MDRQSMHVVLQIDHMIAFDRSADDATAPSSLFLPTGAIYHPNNPSPALMQHTRHPSANIKRTRDEHAMIASKATNLAVNSFTNPLDAFNKPGMRLR